MPASPTKLDYQTPASQAPYPWLSFMFAFLGFGYGGILWFLGFLTAGAGHGDSTVFALAASPLWLLHNFIIALLAPLLWWPCTGILLGQIHRRSRLILFLCLMAAHYASVFPILTSNPFADEPYLRAQRVYEPMMAGIALYAVGQLALWLVFTVLMVRISRAGRNR